MECPLGMMSFRHFLKKFRYSEYSDAVTFCVNTCVVLFRKTKKAFLYYIYCMYIYTVNEETL